jgi:hypothetical protein
MCKGRLRGKWRPFARDDGVDSGGYRTETKVRQNMRRTLVVEDGGDGENP